MVNGVRECGYNSSQADLGVSLNASGLIDVNAYYASTTATVSSPGGVTGRLQASGVQQGSGARPDWQSSVDYVAAAPPGFVLSGSNYLSGDDGSDGTLPALPSGAGPLSLAFTISGASSLSYNNQNVLMWGPNVSNEAAGGFRF